MGRKQEALRFRCPECEAKSAEPCTYLTEQWKNIGPWPYRRVRAASVGEPTKQPHNGRLRKLWEAEQRAEREAYNAKARFDPLADVRRAQADFMRQEHAMLRDWLRSYGVILWA